MGHFNPTIRLLDHPPMSGPKNMAVDWWLLNHAEQPTLRLYGWDDPTLTVGYRQQFNPPDELAALMDRWPTTVRPTGGGYLLHTGELTYSFSVPSEHPMAELSIMEFYGLIRDSFVNSLQHAGDLSDVETGNQADPSADCLKAPSNHEPTVDGDKWMASAQVRHQGSVLQHGSLYFDETEWPVDWPGTRPGFLDVDTLERLERILINGFLGNDPNDVHIVEETLSANGRDQVESLVSLFRVTGVADLPSFQRTDLTRNP